MRRLIVVVGLAGCDRVFGLATLPTGDAPVADAPVLDSADLDLDGDQIPDSIDPCVAPASDGDADTDGDTFPNRSDACPFDVASPVDTDADGDGLAAVCDPFANHVDHRRCTMAFTDAGFDSLMWRPRAPDASWANLPDQLSAAGGGLHTTIAAESFERAAQTITYDVKLDVDTQNSADGSVTVWLRASPDAPGAGDLGCAFYRSAGFHYAVAVGGQLVNAFDIGTPATTIVRLRATITLGDPATVSCALAVDGLAFFPPTTATAPLVAGRFGLSADLWTTSARGIDVIDD